MVLKLATRVSCEVNITKKMFRKFSNIFILNNSSFHRYISDMPKTVQLSGKRNKICKEFLVSGLGVSTSKASIILKDYPRISHIDETRFSEIINILNKYNINTENVHKHPEIFVLSSKMLECHIMYLKEIGFNDIPVGTVVRFRKSIKKPVYIYKDYNLISKDLNVPEYLVSVLKPEPDVLPCMGSFSDSDAVHTIHDKIFNHYLAWRLKIPVSQIESKPQLFEYLRLKCFGSLCRLLKLLLDDFQFTSKKFLANANMTPMYPETIENVIKSYPTLLGVDIKYVLNKYPRLLPIPAHNYTEILKHFKEYEVPDEAIRRSFDVFTLSPETVLQRLKEIDTIPEFKALRRNPRIVQLLVHQNKAKMRLEQLKTLKVKCASIHLLSGGDQLFEKFIHEGSGKTRGFDITNSLGLELKMSSKEVREKLSVNPHWCHVPLTTVHDSLKYLLGRGFLVEEIALQPIVVLYPREKLKEALQEIKENPLTRNKIIKPQHQISLCIYFIERRNHFSGDGIWPNTT